MTRRRRITARCDVMRQNRPHLATPRHVTPWQERRGRKISRGCITILSFIALCSGKTQRNQEHFAINRDGPYTTHIPLLYFAWHLQGTARVMLARNIFSPRSALNKSAPHPLLRAMVFGRLFGRGAQRPKAGLPASWSQEEWTLSGKPSGIAVDHAALQHFSNVLFWQS